MFQTCTVLVLMLWGVLGGVFVSYAQAPFKGRALIVGVNAYQDPNISSLQFSVPDCQLLAGVLADPQRSLFGASDVRLLTDLGKTDADKPTRINVLQGIQWLSEAGPEETILFYFSGHGVVAEGKHYLAGSDVRLNAIPFTGISVDDVNGLLDDVKRTRARQVVVIFDSCHSGTRRGARAMGTESGALIEKLMQQAEGRVTLASCQPEEQSFEDPEFNHGVFTYYLVEALKGAADGNTDGLVDVSEAYTYAFRQVTQWAKKKGNAQTPKMASNVSGTIFLTKDPVRWAQVSAEKGQQLERQKRLRDQVTRKLGRGENDLSGDDGSLVLASLDRLIGGTGTPTDIKIEELATRFCESAIGAEATRAELKLLLGPHTQPMRSTSVLETAADGLKLQLFQPQWDVGVSPDEFKVTASPGSTIKVVGTATSPANIARVLLNGQPLKLNSLSRDLVMVSSAQPENNMRFEGSLTVGNESTNAILTAVDTLGRVRMVALNVQVQEGLMARPSNVTVAVVGLNKRGVDQYEDLRSLRVGQGLHNQLLRATRDTNRFTLVEEKSEILRGLVDMQWMQKQNVSAFNQSTAIAAGKLMGAKYVLYGEIYDFASPKENKGKLYIAVEVRLVDVETARLIPGYGEAEMRVSPNAPGETDFDRTSLATLSATAIRKALEDIFAKGRQQGV